MESRHRAPPASESRITCAPTCAIRSSRCWASPRECGQRSTGNATAAGSTTTASIVLEYPGIRAQLRAGMLVREPGPRFAVYGTNGAYVKYGLDPQEDALLQIGAKPAPGDWCTEAPSQWGSASRRARPTRLSDRNGQLHAFLRPGPRYAARGEGSGRYA